MVVYDTGSGLCDCKALSKSVNIRSAWLMLGAVRTISSTKQKWFICRPSIFGPCGTIKLAISLARHRHRTICVK
ncbi:hypothetical protein KIN20_020661 [Parelaphostrongylus tenuis]|uniref:Uncharacterized protein n=1 Tax=Parelaphostrongylus tenuis TaxID=148309 RepID=A0AAD5MMS4_PARTN|nr:hypothetical protein KIN20_020661 [Parelaphostrongylus tenuis]